MRNMLILADLNSPLMLSRIKMLENVPCKKYILHNANNMKLDEKILLDYEGFIVLEQPRIRYVLIRYLYSFFYTLFLLCTLSPELIVVHWASRLYQNILLALWGKRVIVHTMGGDIDIKQDYQGKKKFFTDLLLQRCKVITVKSEHMAKMILDHHPNIPPSKIIRLSWGVQDRFRQNITLDEQKALQRKLFAKEFEYVFFSIRAFTPFYRQKEIIESFLQCFKDNKNVCLVISCLRVDEAYKQSIALLDAENIILCAIDHEKIDQYILASDCVVSYSLSDGLSQSLMEAVALKKWVLTNALPNHDELLQNGVNAIYVDDGKLQQGFLDMLELCKINHPVQISNELLNIHSQQELYLNALKEFFYI